MFAAVKRSSRKVTTWSFGVRRGGNGKQICPLGVGNETIEVVPAHWNFVARALRRMLLSFVVGKGLTKRDSLLKLIEDGFVCMLSGTDCSATPSTCVPRLRRNGKRLSDYKVICTRLRIRLEACVFALRRRHKRLGVWPLAQRQHWHIRQRWQKMNPQALRYLPRWTHCWRRKFGGRRCGVIRGRG